MICYIDTETTGLDPERHEIWEVALISENREDGVYDETVWQLPVDLGRADPIALQVGQFYERRARSEDICPLVDFARDFATITRGAHLCGAIVSFDEQRLRRLLMANGACPEWHYHLIDVASMALGWLHGSSAMVRDTAAARKWRKQAAVPWKGSELFSALGLKVNDPQYAQHTALGDARLVKAAYELMTGVPQ